MVAAVLFMVVVVAFVARVFVAGLLGVDDFRVDALAVGAAERLVAGAAFFAGAFAAAARPVVADFFDGAGFGFFDAAIRASFPAC